MGIRYRVTQENALTALVAVGLVLRVWQYAANPSLWYDELSIARNLTQLSLRQLVTGPLLYTQIAPVGRRSAARRCSANALRGWSVRLRGATATTPLGPPGDIESRAPNV
jgi:hypothetical protein